jgi:hypothetical protein
MAISNTGISGFRKWAETYDPPGRGGARSAGVGIDPIIAAPPASQRETAPAAEPHRPWLVPGVGTL